MPTPAEAISSATVATIIATPNVANPTPVPIVFQSKSLVDDGV